MQKRKLFHVLVLTGGTLGSALAATACADDGPENPAPPTRQQSAKAVAADDADGGPEQAPPVATAPTSGSGSGSHFW